MKLYEIYINNGWDYGDEESEIKLIVANSEEEANVRAENLLKDVFGEGGKYNNPYFFVKEIEKVDGYKISVSECEHENKDYYNHGYHCVCRDCDKEIY